MLKVSSPKNNGAFFFDRDGTLIHDAAYLHDPALVQLMPNAKKLISKLQKEGFRIFLFTNQSGIARGFFTYDDAVLVNKRVEELLFSKGGFDEVCIAPEHPDEPAVYRKPSPRFINEMCEKYGLLKEKCCMVGDRTSDLESAVNAGIRAVLYCGDIVNDKATLYAREHGFLRTDNLNKVLELSGLEG